MDMAQQVLDQLVWHWESQARPRLDGLTDEELHWEPALGSWGVRHTDDAPPSTVTHRAGSGDWLIDWGMPEPTPAPVTTIAWRVGHIVVGVLGARVHSHFGGPPADYLTWDYAGTAEAALRQLDAGYAAWVDGVRTLAPEDWARPVGEAEGSWAESPMSTLVLHIHRELIHHMAEIALLRDLWANGVR